MADETVINGEFSDDRPVEILGAEDSSKISGLTEKISSLEQEKAKTIRQNEGYKQEIGDLKSSIQELTSEIVELKKQVDKTESENKANVAVAARAAELEGQVSRLQHDLISATTDLQESKGKASDLRRDLEGVKEERKSKDVKLEAIVKERDLLLSKVEKLEEVQSSLIDESQGKEKEIPVLKKRIEGLEVVVKSVQSLEKSKNELEMKIAKMKVQIKTLKGDIKEKENVIVDLETERASVGALTSGEENITSGGLKQKDWVVVGGSAVSVVALAGAICYMHARKQ